MAAILGGVLTLGFVVSSCIVASTKKHHRCNKNLKSLCQRDCIQIIRE